jgi:hypothetical protein
MMEANLKKILIIYPHFPPSNLAGVHRPRLFAQHLPEFGWAPTILTVHEKYYEEEPDWNLVELLPASLRIEKVSAYRIGKPRLIGDIGLRAFFQLYKRAKQLIKEESYDFLYIPIPSFYCALLGRWLHASTGIKYGIDYIDPWIHDFPGSDEVFSRHWFSKQIAKWLEPIAVKKSSLITGVATGYYEPVLERNPHLKTQAKTGAMPYGAEAKDHEILASMKLHPYLFEKKANKFQLIYAGAMLPRAYALLEAIFACIQREPAFFADVELHFIGTGSTPDDASGFTIRPLAERYNLWGSVVFEYPQRIPYLDVLIHLQQADGIFILGSTEPHYTPSKTYQGILSNKPLLCVLHKQSSAITVVEDSNAGVVLRFDGEHDIDRVETSFASIFAGFRDFVKDFQPAQVRREIFEQYSAKQVTSQLAELINLSFAQDAK